jgi:thiamine biosynthesis lipoprotein
LKGLEQEQESGNHQSKMKVQCGVLLGLMAGIIGLEAELLRFEESRLEMGTLFRMVVYTENEQLANQGLTAAFARVSKLNSLLSDYLPQSELSQLSENSGKGEIRRVSDELWTVLRTADKVSRKSAGAFDVSVGPHARLWKIARAKREMPAKSRLQMFHRAVGYWNIEYFPENQSVRLKEEKMFLDLGGIAKGYAADEALKTLQEHGIGIVLIDAGGDLVLGDAPPERKGWKIAVGGNIHPDLPVLELANCAVATSGDTEQFVEIKGVRYSHIVNPRSGIGITNQRQATIISPTGIYADALASTGCILPICDLEKVLAMQPETRAYIVEKNPEGCKTLTIIP